MKRPAAARTRRTRGDSPGRRWRERRSQSRETEEMLWRRGAHLAEARADGDNGLNAGASAAGASASGASAAGASAAGASAAGASAAAAQPTGCFRERENRTGHQGRSGFVRVQWPFVGRYAERNGPWLCHNTKDGQSIKMVRMVCKNTNDGQSIGQNPQPPLDAHPPPLGQADHDDGSLGQSICQNQQPPLDAHPLVSSETERRELVKGQIVWFSRPDGVPSYRGIGSPALIIGITDYSGLGRSELSRYRVRLVTRAKFESEDRFFLWDEGAEFEAIRAELSIFETEDVPRLQAIFATTATSGNSGMIDKLDKPDKDPPRGWLSGVIAPKSPIVLDLDQ